MERDIWRHMSTTRLSNVPSALFLRRTPIPAGGGGVVEHTIIESCKRPSRSKSTLYRAVSQPKMIPEWVSPAFLTVVLHRSEGLVLDHLVGHSDIAPLLLSQQRFRASRVYKRPVWGCVLACPFPLAGWPRAARLGHHLARRLGGPDVAEGFRSHALKVCEARTSAVIRPRHARMPRMPRGAACHAVSCTICMAIYLVTTMRCKIIANRSRVACVCSSHVLQRSKLSANGPRCWLVGPCGCVAEHVASPRG